MIVKYMLISPFPGPTNPKANPPDRFILLVICVDPYYSSKTVLHTVPPNPTSTREEMIKNVGRQPKHRTTRDKVVQAT